MMLMRMVVVVVVVVVDGGGVGEIHLPRTVEWEYSCS